VGGTRPVVRVERPEQVADGVERLGLRRGRPVLVLVGGADGMSDVDRSRAGALLRDAVFPLLDRLDAVVVDGGTDSGVMRAAGRARDAVAGRFPLVGVVLGDVIGQESGLLEPYHTHLLLVPGAEWGDESPWIAGVASVVAGGEPSATLVINGGRITFTDIGHSLDAGRPIVVVAGSGRTADAVAAAAEGSATEPLATQAATSALTTVVELDDPVAVTAALESVLKA
jgi:hypothetical protein